MSKKKKKTHKTQNITNGSFSFIKYVCSYCGKRIYSNKLFCNMECQLAYFEKRNKIKAEKVISKKKNDKRHIYGLRDILTNEEIDDMVEKIKKNIEKKYFGD